VRLFRRSFLFLLTFASAAHAQTSLTDSLYRAGDEQASYAAALQQAAAAPTDYEVLWRAARAKTIRGRLSNDPNPVKARFLEEGETFARRAIAIDSGRPAAHYWLAAAMGLHSRVVSVVAAARLAASVHHEALIILSIDSLNADAHGLLGKLSSDACALDPLTRLVAGAVVGVPVSRSGVCAGAERELMRAIALDRDSALWRVDLVELYIRMRRLADAERELETVVLLPPRTPADADMIREIRAALDSARRRG